MTHEQAAYRHHPLDAEAPTVADQQAELRDRIADVLAAADGWTWTPDFDRNLSPVWQGYLKRADVVLAVLPPPADRAAELASLAVNSGRALRDEKRHYEIACQENARLRATIERVRRLHDALDAETDLTSPDDEITRGGAARKIAAALDGWTDPDELRRMAAEAQQQPEAETPASTAPLAAGLPLVKGNCPACRSASLFLGSGGYVTCARLDCPEPDAATTVLEQPAAADTGEEAEA